MQTTHTETTGSQVRTNEAAIFGRLLTNGHVKMSEKRARFILSLDFSDEEKARIHELAVKNQEGKISPKELEELDSYLKVGNELAILQSEARMVMKKSKNR